MPVRTDRQIENGLAGEVGLSILGIGMITGMHAAISPSVFTFTCFAKKPEEKAIAEKTLLISLGATSLTSIGLLLVFGRWLPAIISEATAIGLFGLGTYAVRSSGEAPAQPSMAVPKSEFFGIGRVSTQPHVREEVIFQ